MDLSSLSSIILAGIGLLLALILPGAVWLLWARPEGIDALEWIAEAVGSSLALVALAGMLLALLGVSFNAFGVAALTGGLMLVWIAVKLWQGGRLRVQARTLLMVGALLALAAWRFYQARTLVMPAWVDSVHHTLLVRLILERGAIPGDWMPYLPVPMFYHYGFHSSAALFSFFSRIEPSQSLLIFGNALNALVAAAVYRLGKALWGSTARAAVAGLLVGFVFQMPAYYVSWGRYPLLAGLAVLPLALAAALDVRRCPWSRGAWARLALYAAGICFCHFLAVGLLILFLLVLAGFETVKAWRARSMRVVAWQPLAGAALGALAAAPWLARVWTYSSSYFGVDVVSPLDASQAQASTELLNYLLYLLGPWRSHFLLILAGLGLVLAFRNVNARLLAVWGGLMALMATPWGPRFAPFRPDHLAIVLFLPASLLAADVLVSAGEALGRTWRRIAGQIGVGLAVCCLLLWGIVDGRDILNPVTTFTTPADVTALRWIEQNTPPTARFFINVTPWQGTLYRGVDGGYWITSITGRGMLLPPAVYAWSDPEVVQMQTETFKQASQLQSCSDAFWGLIEQNHLTHIYLREQAGSLQPSALEGCAGVILRYQQEGVWIYEINSSK